MLLPCYLHPWTAPPTLPQILSDECTVRAKSWPQVVCARKLSSHSNQTAAVADAAEKLRVTPTTTWRTLREDFANQRHKHINFRHLPCDATPEVFLRVEVGCWRGQNNHKNMCVWAFGEDSPSLLCVAHTHTQTEERPAHISTLTFIITNHLWQGICC